MANQFIKRANQETDYTPELINELRKCKKDPIYFIRNYIKVQHPKRGNVAFDLYPYQEKLINQLLDPNNRFNIALLSRQMRKITDYCYFFIMGSNVSKRSANSNCFKK